MKDNWANRKEGLKCRSCKYFVLKSGVVGRCRRHAPCQVGLGYPVVFESDWCGDFKLNETVYNEQVERDLEAVFGEKTLESWEKVPSRNSKGEFTKQLDEAFQEKKKKKKH